MGDYMHFPCFCCFYVFISLRDNGIGCARVHITWFIWALLAIHPHGLTAHWAHSAWRRALAKHVNLFCAAKQELWSIWFIYLIRCFIIEWRIWGLASLSIFRRLRMAGFPNVCNASFDVNKIICIKRIHRSRVNIRRIYTSDGGRVQQPS